MSSIDEVSNRMLMEVFEGYRDDENNICRPGSRGYRINVDAALMKLSECLDSDYVVSWAVRNKITLPDPKHGMHVWRKAIADGLSAGTIHMNQASLASIKSALFKKYGPFFLENFRFNEEFWTQQPLGYLLGIWVIADQMLIGEPDSYCLSKKELKFVSELQRFIHRACCTKLRFDHGKDCVSCPPQAQESQTICSGFACPVNLSRRK